MIFFGKTDIPFCAHARSGLSRTQETIENLCKGAIAEDGLVVRQDSAE